jgi:3-oxoacyl-[acyl-carrier-protein] synthase III
VVATTTPDYLYFFSGWSTAKKLGLPCCGFDLSRLFRFGYAFTTACQFIENNFYKNVILVAVDTSAKMLIVRT